MRLIERFDAFFLPFKILVLTVLISTANFTAPLIPQFRLELTVTVEPCFVDGFESDYLVCLITFNQIFNFSKIAVILILVFGTDLLLQYLCE